MEGDDGLTIYGWQSRQKRMQELVAAAAAAAAWVAADAMPTEPMSPPLYKVMEPLMRIVREGGHVDDFISTLEMCFREYGYSPTTILHHLCPSRSSLLHVAAGAKTGEEEILRLIIDYFPEHLVVAQDDRGDTALHVAARAGRINAAEILSHRNLKLYNNGDLIMVRIKNKFGDTALHEATSHGHHQMVHWLLSKDAEPVYWENFQKKSPLYLAVDKSDLEMVLILLKSFPRLDPLRMQGMSPAHAAVAYSKLDALRRMSQESPTLLLSKKDSGGGNPLHLAAYQNNIGAVQILLESFTGLAYERDTDGDLPIHVACKMGHVDTIQKLLLLWPDPARFINQRGQNILHVSAKYGSIKAVEFLLQDSKLKVLINERDYDGNTPLHLAVMYLQSRTLAYLARHPTVKLDLLNNDCLTSFDVAMQNLRRKTTFRKWLVGKVFWSILSSAPFNSKDQCICSRREVDQSPLIKITKQEVGRMLNKEVDTLLIVATLAVGATFAAGFIVPGGDSSATIPGGHSNATGVNGCGGDSIFQGSLLNKIMFDIFVVCNGLALANSLLSVFLLIWVQLMAEDTPFALYLYAIAPLPIGLVAMSVAFVCGIYVVVNKITWLWAIVLFVGLIFLIVGICGLIAVYALIMPSHNHLLRTFNLAIIDIFDFLMRSFPVQFMEEEDTKETNSESASTSASASRPLNFDDKN